MRHSFGLNIGIHDSSVCYLEKKDGKLEPLILLSERITRVKHQGLFPFQALKRLHFRLKDQWAAIKKESISTNCFGTRARTLEEKYAQSTPEYRTLMETLQLQDFSSLYNERIDFQTHHLCHAFSSLFQCPFETALIVVSDGVGNSEADFPSSHDEYHFTKGAGEESKEYLTIYELKGGQVRPLEKFWASPYKTSARKLNCSDGLGTLFEAASQLIFGNWNFAGKIMGLAAYGKASSISNQEEYIQSLDQLTTKWDKESLDDSDSEVFQLAADISATVQKHFEERMVTLLQKAKARYPEHTNLILSGGCALNCLLNDRILKEKLFSRVFVPAFPNDEGISLGAALLNLKASGDYEFKSTPWDELSAAWGDSESAPEMNHQFVASSFADCEVSFHEDIEYVAARLIAGNEIIAWVQGRSEVGPRALGNRSILASPLIKGLKLHLNRNIKFREHFRPYGASVLQDFAHKYFEVPEDYQSPFMTFAPLARKEKAAILGDLVHVDGSCRIQTVMQGQNESFFRLLYAFHELTGVPVLLNTSLNVMGQPILESLSDARLFMDKSEIKFMVYGKFLIKKKI